jgi:activator of 2-hydroxyglutaryl-CoA dehydratase
MASKIVTLVTRVGFAPDCGVTGGGAKNKGLVKAIEEELEVTVFVSDEPRITAAFGAALIAFERFQEK